MEPGQGNEKPLSGAAKISLVAAAGAAILLFYLYAIAVILVLLVLLAFEFILVLILLRVGLAGFVIREIEKQGQVLSLLSRSFFLRNGTEFRMPVKREEAPRLFAMLEKLTAKLDIAVPHEVSLEMNTGAWVRLKGFRQGAGKTILGIGYDLLAGLSEAEVEAVLAHEMSHARLVRRGYKRWLNSGLGRAAKLTGMLAGYVEAYRQAEVSDGTAGWIYGGADALTRLAARCVAAYSRQDEFEADRGAAELCGSAPIRSSLMKLEAINEKASRLPWRERVAQLQLGEGVSRWLVKELSGDAALATGAVEHEAFDKYATHPRMADRIAALPEDGSTLTGPQAPGLELLADPDGMAEKLLGEIQRTLAKEEQKDTKELKKWLQKIQKSGSLRPLQTFGMVVLWGGIVGGMFYGVFTGNAKSAIAIMILSIPAGLWIRRAGRYKDRHELAVPDFAVFNRFWLDRPLGKDIDAGQPALKQELRGRLGSETRQRVQEEMMARECYAALEKCDYARAYAAADILLGIDYNSPEGNVTRAISAAAFLRGEQSSQALANLQRITKFSAATTAWAGAWVLLLDGEWARAEAFLDEALKHRPGETTLLTLRAFSQMRRRKLQSATINARQACSPAPKNVEHAKVLIDLLLDGGYLREAREQLLPLEQTARTDSDLMFDMTRLNLLQKNFEKADEWSALLKQNPLETCMLVHLGQVYESARRDAQAETFYRDALTVAFYPEAHLGLGRLELARKNKTEARAHLLAGLDHQRPLGEKGLGPVSLFGPLISHLLALEEPGPNRRGWLVSFGNHTEISALANQTVVVFGADRGDAEKHLNDVLSAMQAGKPAGNLSISWQDAPQQHQPEGLARSGIQYVVS